MKTMKQRRERLLGKKRPLVRLFDPQADMWVLWAAYDLESFHAIPKELTFKEFSALVMAQVSARSSCLVIEDDCKYFKSGRGPACFVVVDNFGWRIEPHADYFRWATPRMKLRCTVAFLQMARYSKLIGVCLVRSLAKTANLFEHAQKYVMLTTSGRIPLGDPRGDEYLFSIKGSAPMPVQGERNAGTHGIGRGAGNGVQRDDSGGRATASGNERSGELSRGAVQGERGREGDDGEGAGSGAGGEGHFRSAIGREIEEQLAAAGSVGGV